MIILRILLKIILAPVSLVLLLLKGAILLKSELLRYRFTDNWMIAPLE